MSSKFPENGARSIRGGPARRDVLACAWPKGARAVLAVLMLLALGSLWLKSHENRRSAARIRGVPTLVVDPNTAPVRVLTALPHVGPALASHLVAARELEPFTSLDDAGHRVRGLGPATLAQLAPHFRIAATAHDAGRRDRAVVEPTASRKASGSRAKKAASRKPRPALARQPKSDSTAPAVAIARHP